MHKTRRKGSLIRSERNKKSAIIIAIISKTHRGKLFMNIINWANISLHFAINGQSANLRVFGLNKLQWDFSLSKIWSEGLKKQLTKYWSLIYLHSSNVNVKIKIHYEQAVLTVLSAAHIHSEGFSADLWATAARKIQPVSRSTAHNSRVQHIWTMIVYYTGATVADFKGFVCECRTDWHQDAQTPAHRRTLGHTRWISAGRVEEHTTQNTRRSAQPGPKCRLLTINVKKAH